MLIVCAGNICRSPAAEAAVRAEAEAAGIDIEVDSAGTGSWNLGEPPFHQMVEVGRRHGLEITGKARRFGPSDFDRFDVILVMDRSNLRDVLAMAPSLEARAKVRLFRTYDPNSEEDEIPDPFGGPPEGYETAFEMIQASARGFIESLTSLGAAARDD
ncbi:MAG TPA: low molecular weight protein-tyrosine-phosphatase [Acidimicrobiia bacterium]